MLSFPAMHLNPLSPGMPQPGDEDGCSFGGGQECFTTEILISIEWQSVVAKKLYHPRPGLWPGLASALHFNVSSWCRQQVSEEGSAEATLIETFPSWPETLGAHAWGMATSSS